MKISCEIIEGLEKNFKRALKHYSFNGKVPELNSDALTLLFVIKGVINYLEENKLEITEKT